MPFPRRVATAWMLAGSIAASALAPGAEAAGPSPAPTASTATTTPTPAGPTASAVEPIALGPRGYYRGLTVTFPAAWPVVDLEADARACPRLDRTAVYLGSGTGDRDCPDRAIGRAEGLWLEPTADQGAPGTGRSERRGQLAVESVDRPTSRQELLRIPARSVIVTANLPAQDPAGPAVRSAAERALDSVREAGSPAPAVSARAMPSAEPSATTTATTSGTVELSSALRTSAGTTALPTAAASTGRVLTGMAFDTCAAPTVATMQAWRASPYAAVGVYIGGANGPVGTGT